MKTGETWPNLWNVWRTDGKTSDL